MKEKWFLFNLLKVFQIFCKMLLKKVSHSSAAPHMLLRP